MPLTCKVCRRQFHNEDTVQALVLSKYHNVEKPGSDAFQYAIERPFACLSIEHLYCTDAVYED